MNSIEQLELGPMLTGELDDPNLELLHEPLRRCIWRTDAGVFVKHPWVNTFLPFVGEVNRLYERKFSMAREYLSSGDFRGYLRVVVERPWRMSTLERWYARGRLDTTDAQELLVDIWSDTENPSGNLEDPAYLWRELGFATDDQAGWDALPNELTIWRGGRLEGGVSWTLKRPTAEMFARRFSVLHGPPKLWKAIIDKSQVLGYVTGRGEAEVIVDPVGHGSGGGGTWNARRSY